MNAVERAVGTTSSGAPLSLAKAWSRRPASDLRLFEPLITAVEAGSLLVLHPVTVLRWCREGRIPHIRLGRRVMFRASELNLWLASNYKIGVAHAA